MKDVKITKILGGLFLMVGAFAISSTTLIFWNQPKCPNELLK